MHVDHLFGCPDKGRLYKLLDCLERYASELGAKNPYPQYIGDGFFKVVVGNHSIELQDTNLGVTRLVFPEASSKQYKIARRVFSRYWEDNYNSEYQKIVRESRKVKVRS